MPSLGIVNHLLGHHWGQECIHIKVRTCWGVCSSSGAFRALSGAFFVLEVAVVRVIWLGHFTRIRAPETALLHVRFSHLPIASLASLGTANGRPWPQRARAPTTRFLLVVALINSVAYINTLVLYP